MAYARSAVQERVIKIKIPKSKVLPKYHDHLMDFKTERLIFWGGAGSGKSYLIALKVVLTLLRSKRRALICRKYGSTLEDSVWKDIMYQIEQLGILKHCKINKSTKKIWLPNGSELIFKPLDDETKVKSISKISLIWVEECTEINKEMYNQLEARLRGKQDCLPEDNEQLILSFNPVSKSNWVYSEFFDPRDPQTNKKIQLDPNKYKIIHSNYLDNPFLPKEFINTIEGYKITNPRKYEIYALGKFASLNKLVFPNYEVMELDLWELGHLEDRAGIDFGFNDPTGGIYCKYDNRNRIIYIYREFYQTECVTSDIYNLIAETGGLMKRWKGDSARPETIRELQNLGINITGAKKGHGSIMDGIDFLNDHRIIVDPSCVHMIEEFDNYSYKFDKETGEYLDEPLDDGWCHLCDALRYAFSVRDYKIKPAHKL